MDAITKAANIAKLTQSTPISATKINDVIANAATQADELSSNTQALSNNLPVDKNPELIRREIEADILEKEAKLKEVLMTDREKLIEEAKQKLKALALPTIPLPLKIPLIDPKILQAVAIAKQIKQLAKQRRTLAKKYLSKGEELYSYPIKPYDVTIPTKPNKVSVPEAPTPPQLPLKNIGK
jgi:hypothetical protein